MEKRKLMAGGKYVKVNGQFIESIGYFAFDGCHKFYMIEDKDDLENPMLKGIASIFGTSGSSKIVINPQTTVDQLMTIPGIFPEGSGGELDEDDQADSQELAQCIIDTLKVMPEDYDVDETRDWWPYKDWQDLNQRLEDSYNGDIQLGEDAQQYIDWNPSETSVFTSLAWSCAVRSIPPLPRPIAVRRFCETPVCCAASFSRQASPRSTIPVRSAFRLSALYLIERAFFSSSAACRSVSLSARATFSRSNFSLRSVFAHWA